MSFLTVDNMRVVIDGMVSDIGPVAAAPFPLRRIAYDVMRGISEDPVYADSTLSQLNVAAVAAAVSVTRMMAADRRGAVGDTAQPPAGNSVLPLDPTVAPVPMMEPDPPGTRVTQHRLSLDGADRGPSDLMRSRYKTAFDVIKGAVSVRVDNVILPVRVRRRRANEVNQANQDNDVARPNFGYVWLQFDEVSGPYTHNLEPHARASFCKLVTKGSYTPDGGRGHLLLEPAHPEPLDLVSPIGALASLTTTLRSPDGGLLDFGEDAHRLTAVIDTGVAGNIWTFRMSPGWTDDAFSDGDVVRLRGADSKRGELDAYINRREGHIVLSIVNDNEVYTAFNVLGPRVPDGRGGYVPDAAIGEQRREVEDAQDAAALAGNELEAFGTGCLATNLSLQASVSVTVTSRAQIL